MRATEADCTFAPTGVSEDPSTELRFLDVSATSFATGAQSDTRTIWVRPQPVPARGTR